ncbi:hypothetical protein RI367_003795 [Sorochytrium milnesiophthora]
MANFVGMRVNITTASGLVVEGVVLSVSAENQQLMLEKVVAKDAFGRSHTLPQLALPGREIQDLKLLPDEEPEAAPAEDPAIISYSRENTPAARQFTVPTSAAKRQSTGGGVYPALDQVESDTSESDDQRHATRQHHYHQRGHDKQRRSPKHGTSHRAPRKEPLQHGAVRLLKRDGQRRTSPSRKDDRGGGRDARTGKGWAQEDVSDYHESEFDFQLNLDKFDKQRVFEEIRANDNVAPEDRLVHTNINRDLLNRARNYDQPLAKLSHKENVLDSVPAPPPPTPPVMYAYAGDKEEQGAAHQRQPSPTGSDSRYRQHSATTRQRQSMHLPDDRDHDTEPARRASSAYTLGGATVAAEHGRHSSPRERHETSESSSSRAHMSRIGSRGHVSSSDLPPPSPVNEVQCRTANGVTVPSVTVLQTLAIERLLSQQAGPSEDALIENAGRSVAQLIMQLLGGSRRFNQHNHNSAPHVVFLAGNNKNGAHTLCAARHLANRGALVTAVAASAADGAPESRPAPSDLTSLLAKAGFVHEQHGQTGGAASRETQSKPIDVVAQQMRYLKHAGGRIVGQPEDVPDAVIDMVVDGLLGFLTLRDLPSEMDRRIACDLMAWTKSLRAPILSVDVPSGVDATTGAIAYPPHHINPRWTVCLGIPKSGVLTRGVAGELFLADMGIPSALWEAVGVRGWPAKCGPWEDRFVVPLDTLQRARQAAANLVAGHRLPAAAAAAQHLRRFATTDDQDAEKSNAEPATPPPTLQAPLPLPKVIKPKAKTYTVLPHRTDLTSRLWLSRYDKNNEDFKAMEAKSSGVDWKHRIVLKKMSDSYVEEFLPFKSNPQVREEYINFYGSIRIAKILEDLDAMAGQIAYIHCDDGTPDTPPLTLVTASVDRMDLLKRPSADEDLKLSGCLTFVGHSSMEVSINVQEVDGSVVKAPIMSAKFTFVARDPRTNTAVQVNPLVLQNDTEKMLFAMGADLKARKKQAAESALGKTPPTSEERLLIHDLWLQSKKYTDSKAPLPTHSAWMKDTQLSSVVITQPQDRNIHNNIFGGYLMRLAFELAYATGTVFCNSHPQFLAMDDIWFRRPVPIGSLLSFNSQVVYSRGYQDGRSFQVQVTADVIDPLTLKRETTNVFHLTFTSPQHKVPAIMPQTYEEAMRYLDGKRKWEVGYEMAKEHRSSLIKDWE